MDSKCSILIFGASYGSLLAVKLLGAGHDVTLVCRQATAELINAEGVRVRMPGAGRGETVEVDSRRLPGHLSATTPADIDCADYDLVVLAIRSRSMATASCARRSPASRARSFPACRS